MKSVMFFTFTIFILIWLIFTTFLLGFFPADALPGAIKTVALPLNTAELGSSYGVINGIFLSFAVVLGIVAIIVQGKALQASIRSQNEQTAALTFQISQQNHANRLSALTAQLKYYQTESDRLDEQYEKLTAKLEHAKSVKNDISIKETQPIIKDTLELRKTYAEVTKEINIKIGKLMDYEPKETT